MGERSYGEAVREHADRITATESGALNVIRAAIINAATPGKPIGQSESLKRRAAQAFKDLSREEQQQQADDEE